MGDLGMQFVMDHATFHRRLRDSLHGVTVSCPHVVASWWPSRGGYTPNPLRLPDAERAFHTLGIQLPGAPWASWLPRPVVLLGRDTYGYAPDTAPTSLRAEIHASGAAALAYPVPPRAYNSPTAYPDAGRVNVTAIVHVISALRVLIAAGPARTGCWGDAHVAITWGHDEPFRPMEYFLSKRGTEWSCGNSLYGFEPMTENVRSDDLDDTDGWDRLLHGVLAQTGATREDVADATIPPAIVDVRWDPQDAPPESL